MLKAMEQSTFAGRSGAALSELPLVLLVEDEDTLRDIVRRNLEARRYRVDRAATAAEAIAALDRETPAVMLLDINLPDGSGWDVLRALRAQGRRVPTVIVSAVRCNPTRLAEFHPDAYLPKPFPMGALIAAVERLAGRGGTAQREHEGELDMARDTAPEPAAAPPPAAPQTGTTADEPV